MVQLTCDGTEVIGLGVLYGAIPGNDYCNGQLAPIHTTPVYACLCDCVHVEDMASPLTAAGLNRRPKEV